MSAPNSQPSSRRGSLVPPPKQFGAVVTEDLQLKYYNCAPVQPRKGSLTPAEDKDIKLGKSEVFGVCCDEENKVHYYNCAPVKPKKTKTNASGQPAKKMIHRIFKGEGKSNLSGSDCSLSSIGSNCSGTGKNN